MPPQQAQRMGTRFLHQLTNLGSSGNSSHDTPPQPAGNGSSSPVKNQLASFFQKGPNSSGSTPNYPQQQPEISAPTRAMGAHNTFDTAEDPSLRFGEAFSDGISPNGTYMRRAFGNDELADPSGVQAGRFGPMHSFGQVGQNAMLQQPPQQPQFHPHLQQHLQHHMQQQQQQFHLQQPPSSVDHMMDMNAGRFMPQHNQPQPMGISTGPHNMPFASQSAPQHARDMFDSNAVLPDGQPKLTTQPPDVVSHMNTNLSSNAGQVGQGSMMHSIPTAQMPLMQPPSFGTTTDASTSNPVFAMSNKPREGVTTPSAEDHKMLGVPSSAHHEANTDDGGTPLRTVNQWSHTSPTKRMDPAEIDHLSRSYYTELLNFFRTQSIRTSLLTPSRSSAREKLTRLNKQQFAELSTDVHDELRRRQDELQEMPFLQGRDDFHPKRNQARQKLATLPKTRFRDLASDVFFELERRYPELPQELRYESLEDLMGAREGHSRNSSLISKAPAGVNTGAMPGAVPGATNDVEPPHSLVSSTPGAGTRGMEQAPAPVPVPVRVSVPPPASSQSANMPPPPATSGPMPGPTSGSTFGAVSTAPVPGAGSAPTTAVPLSDRRQADPYGTRPLSSSRMSTNLAQQQLTDLMADAQQMSSAEMFAPAHSAAVEEQDPRSLQAAVRTSSSDRDSMIPSASAAAAAATLPAASGAAAPAIDPAEIRAYEEQVGLLQKQVQLLEEQEHVLRAQGTEHDRLVEQLRSQNNALETRLTSLEHELEAHETVARDLRSESDRRQVALDDKEAELLQHRADLDVLRSQYNELNLAHAARSADAESETHWKRQLEVMQRETLEQQQIVQDLRGEVATLLEELRRLSARNDAMTADKESDVAIIRDLHQQMSTYKRRYESAKGELRMVQSTAQLWAQPHVDEWRYVSPNGAVADTNLRSFQSAIDELLSSARSSAPSNVLIAMKTVVLSTTLVTDDVAKYEMQPNNEMASLSPQQREDVETLKVSISDALSNLMNACRNHASSQGLAPVSLIDAAATHVALAVVELIKLLKLRRVPRPDEDDMSFDSMADSGPALGGGSTTPNGLKPLHTRNAASPSHLLSRGTPSRGAGITSPTSLRSLSYSNSNLDARARALDMPTGTPNASHQQQQHGQTTSAPGAGATSSGAADVAASTPTPRPSAVPPRLPNREMSSEPSASTTSQESSRARLPSTETATRPQSPHVPRPPSATSTWRGLSTDQPMPNNGNLQQSTSPESVSTPASSRTPSQSHSHMQQQTRPSSQLAVPMSQQREDEDAEDELENWGELRNYIEVQTEAIVHSIQSLLSALREGAQGVQLNENLTQITTIVSSIVAISRDHLPQATSRHGAIATEAERIFAELTDNCDRLSDMQSNTSFDRSAKSVMASASYGVAKGLKALNELLNAADEAPLAQA